MAPPSFGVYPPPPTTRQWSRWPRRRSTQPDMPRPTTESLRRASTLFLSHDAPVGYVLQTVSSYNLQWLVLRDWLLERFKDHPKLGGTLLKNQEGKEDRFHFHIPRKLTEGEIIEIYKLRTIQSSEKTDPSRHRSTSPDPDPDRDDPA